MKLWHQSFLVLEDNPAYAELMKRRLAEVVRPDTEVEISGFKPGSVPLAYSKVDISHAYFRAVPSTNGLWPRGRRNAGASMGSSWPI